MSLSTIKLLATGLMCCSMLVWAGCKPAGQMDSAPSPSESSSTTADHDHDHGDHDHEDHDHAGHDDDHADHDEPKKEMETAAEAETVVPTPVTKPETDGKPDPEPTESEKPETTKKPEAPKADKPKAEKPEADTSKSETPKPEPPAAEKPEAETSKKNMKPETDQVAAVTPAKKDDSSAQAKSDEKTVTTGDWPMWGGDNARNMFNKTTGINIDFEPALDPADGKNLKFTARLGSQTYGNPVIANGKVFVGTNNGGEYRPQHEGDKGVLLCFDAETGEFLWQLTRDKLPQGRVNDWPEQGICSTPCVEGEFLYVVTNRCEVMCIDINGFYDDENDGPYTEEVDTDKLDADIIWSMDMIEEYGVFPHNLATSSPALHEDFVYVLSSNGVDEAHLEIPAPRSPSFMCLNKKTGELVWDNNEPFDQILHGQWSSPAVGVVNGVAQVYMPGGDGWLYAFDGTSGEIIWKFDLNPKDSKWELGGRGTRNNIVSTPVFMDNSVILSVGQDPEHGEGVGHIYRIDATKSGDVSPVNPDGSPNENSAEIWHYGGVDEDGSITGRVDDLIYRRTISTVAIHDGLVYAPDLSGFLHCLDFKTGKRYWEYDTFAALWGSPMVVDGHIFLGDEDGDLVILAAGKEEKVIAEKLFDSSIYSTPSVANGKMYISDRSRLYCFEIK